jgi:hypothetical protein
MTTKNALINEMKNNETSIQEAKQIQYKPMDDSDIRYYFPNARIMDYAELSKYETIDDLLPYDIDAIFLLYEETENYGHWVLLSKYNETIEMFNSYGDNYIDEPLTWVKMPMRKLLGSSKPYLTNLLKNTNYNDYAIIYNAYDFQDDKNLKISTCGRWCCLRWKTILNNRMPLIKFINMMKEIKKETNQPYDVIVSDLINKV